MSRPLPVLVAGVGNVLLGDDGFGVEVARRMAQRPAREGVRVVDFGIRGIDLTYALLDGVQAAILVDAAPRGRAPGTLYVLEPELAGSEPAASIALEAHSLHPAQVLQTVRAMGGHVGMLRVVGCEPASFDDEGELTHGLSASVAAAIEPAIALIDSLIDDLQRGGHA